MSLLFNVKLWIVVLATFLSYPPAVPSAKAAASPSSAKRSTATLQTPLCDRPQLVKDSIEHNKPIYYFGLGSNMLREKLENRGLNGTKIDIVSMEAAIVPNYRLAFNLRAFPPLEPGMGSLEPVDADSKALLEYENNECHGALVKLSPENYEKLMRSERVGGSNERAAEQGYEEIIVDAYPYKGKKMWGFNNNKSVKAVALRARPHVRLRHDSCPSPRYMNILKDGAKELGLEQSYQGFLSRHPVQNLRAWQKKEAIYNLVFVLSVSSMLKWRGWSKLQSRLLYMVYVRPSAPRTAKIVSDFITAAILLPGAIFGWLLNFVWKWTGTTPPQVTRMMLLLDPSSTKSEPS